jgi:hypothetical protein
MADEPIPVSISPWQLQQLHGFVPNILDSQAGVPADTTNQMIRNEPVFKKHAVLVLATISNFTGTIYNLGNVQVKIISTMQDLYLFYHFQAGTLAVQAGVSLICIDDMMYNKPVSRENAGKVLLALSRRMGTTFTFDNVDVVLEEEEEDTHA